MQPTHNTPANRADQSIRPADDLAQVELAEPNADFADLFKTEESMKAAAEQRHRGNAAAEVRQTLRDTRLYLERHGWNQGEYYDATSGRFTPPACLVGAVGIVCYGGPVDAPAQMFDDPGFGSFEQAVGFLDLYLSHRFGLNVYDYNDAKGRIFAEVSAMLEQAAKAVHGGMFPMCCDRFMSVGEDSIEVGCLAECEPSVLMCHECCLCERKLLVEIEDPDIRERLVAQYRRQAAAASHEGVAHEPGRSDDCATCDRYCFCTPESNCVNHGGTVPDRGCYHFAADADGQMVAINGIVTEVDVKTTHQRRTWATAVLQTDTGRVPLEVFPVYFDSARQALTHKARVCVVGRVDLRSEPGVLRVFSVAPVQEAAR
ncbi:hypothetical protein [Dactylosporangium sp. NPDC049140]|uniref:DUF6197 family protein n=1 Tax=Dactylosporangium sp. NPDC049140 TaxID=3155647 RepID=UPI0033C3C57E